MNSIIRMDTPKVGKGEPEPSYGDALLDAAEVRIEELTSYRGQSTTARSVWRPEVSRARRRAHESDGLITAACWLITGVCIVFAAESGARGAQIPALVGAVLVMLGWTWWSNAPIPERLLVTLRSPDTLGAWRTVERARHAAAGSSPAAVVLREPLRELGAEALRALTVMEDAREAGDAVRSDPYHLPEVAAGEGVARDQQVIGDAWNTARYAATVALAAMWAIESRAILNPQVVRESTSGTARVEDLVLSARKTQQ